MIQLAAYAIMPQVELSSSMENNMAYVDPDYKSKKDFITAVKAGKKHYPYVPGGMFESLQNGTAAIEGPHYPKPHRWYSAVVVKDGVVVSAK